MPNNHSPVKNLVPQPLDTLLSLGHIDNFEHAVFNTLLEISEQNKIGNIGVDSLETRIGELINGWEEQEYTDCDGFGKLSATAGVLKQFLSKSSVTWWKENPEALPIERVFPWVGADISGAVVGTIGGIIAVTAFSEDPFNWGSVGKIGLTAGMAALSASTGILGKVHKFLWG